MPLVRFLISLLGNKMTHHLVFQVTNQTDVDASSSDIVIIMLYNTAVTAEGLLEL
jgi:hypothetical protein